MKTLTTIAEVHALAFSREELISKEVITLSDILEAETRYVCPILGAELCDAIAAGQYASLWLRGVAMSLSHCSIGVARTLVVRNYPRPSIESIKVCCAACAARHRPSHAA